MQNDYSMRTRKRDDKNDKKEVKKPVADQPNSNSKKKKASPKKTEPMVDSKN
jgi:hypothetical protein